MDVLGDVVVVGWQHVHEVVLVLDVGIGRVAECTVQVWFLVLLRQVQPLVERVEVKRMGDAWNTSMWFMTVIIMSMAPMPLKQIDIHTVHILLALMR